MKVAITGAAGYIGSVLSAHLLANDYNVTAIDNFAQGPLGLLPICTNNRLKILKKDIQDLSVDDFKDCKFVYHLASVVGTPQCEKNPEEAKRVNLKGTEHLLRVADKACIVFTNTNIGYPQGHSDETASLTPTGTYSETKLAAERLILAHGGVSMRLASVCGVSPRMRDDLLLNFLVQKAVADIPFTVFDLDSMRNFIHIQDVVKALETAQFVKKGEVFNIALAKHYTKLELLKIIEEELDRPINYKKGDEKDPDQRNYILSTQKWIKQTYQEPLWDVRRSIQQLIRYYEFRQTY